MARPCSRLKLFSATVKPKKHLSCTPHCHGLLLASVILAFPPWPPTLSCLETCFQLRLAIYCVLSDTFWQIQFDFTLEVFLDLILLLRKVIKRVVLFKGQIVSHLLMGIVLFFLKMSIHLNGTTHGVTGIHWKPRHRSHCKRRHLSGLIKRVKVKSLSWTLFSSPCCYKVAFWPPLVTGHIGIYE